MVDKTGYLEACKIRCEELAAILALARGFDAGEWVTVNGGFASAVST